MMQWAQNDRVTNIMNQKERPWYNRHSLDLKMVVMANKSRDLKVEKAHHQEKITANMYEFNEYMYGQYFVCHTELRQGCFSA